MPLPSRGFAVGLLAGAVALLAGCASLSLAADGGQPDAQAEGFTPAPEGALYSFGYALGGPLALQELDAAEIERVIGGLRDRAQGRDSRYGDPELLRPLVGEFLALRNNEIAERNLAAARPFLEAEARAEGAILTEGGAIVRVLEAGEGEAPGSEQRVRLHYDGALSDGTPVRSTRAGEPFELVMARSNRCWREAMALAAPGARLRVVCPPDLMFGMGGRAGWAPPGAVMVWNLDVLGVSGP